VWKDSRGEANAISKEKLEVSQPTGFEALYDDEFNPRHYSPSAYLFTDGNPLSMHPCEWYTICVHAAIRLNCSMCYTKTSISYVFNQYITVPLCSDANKTSFRVSHLWLFFCVH
jgi:hypothetical protein